MAKNILIDAGFLIELCDHSNNNEKKGIAFSLYELISKQNVILPWPILYETFRTKYARKNDVLVYFEAFMNKNNIVFLDDSSYREIAYNNVLDSYKKQTKRYSMVDYILREIITDNNVKIDYLITFNDQDFKDVCALRRIEIFN